MPVNQPQQGQRKRDRGGELPVEQPDIDVGRHTLYRCRHNITLAYPQHEREPIDSALNRTSPSPQDPTVQTLHHSETCAQTGQPAPNAGRLARTNEENSELIDPMSA